MDDDDYGDSWGSGPMRWSSGKWNTGRWGGGPFNTDTRNWGFSPWNWGGRRNYWGGRNTPWGNTPWNWGNSNRGPWNQGMPGYGNPYQPAPYGGWYPYPYNAGPRPAPGMQGLPQTPPSSDRQDSGNQ